MSESVMDKIQARLGDEASKWYWVAFNMAGENANYAFALMHIVQRLHKADGKSVQISHPEWRAALRFGKTLVGNASMTLRKVGVIYTNHGRMTWHIDEEKFWIAFEAAFALVFPLMDYEDDDSDDDSGKPSGDKQVAGDKQVGGKQAEGEPDGEGAGDKRPIESITITTPKEKEEGVDGFFKALRVTFNGQLQAFADRMRAAIEKIGLDAARNVVQRCLHYVETKGRTASWAYLATSLDNEAIALTSDAPRQLKLMPVDEVSPVKGGAPVASTKQVTATKSALGLKTFFFEGVECVRVHVGMGKYKPKPLSAYLREIEDEAREAIRAEQARQQWLDEQANPKPCDTPTTLPDLFPLPAVAPVVHKPDWTGQYADAWQTAYVQLQLQFDQNKFDTWVRDARMIAYEAGVFVIEVKSAMVREMLQNRLYRAITRIVSDAANITAKLQFVTPDHIIGSGNMVGAVAS